MYLVPLIFRLGCAFALVLKSIVLTWQQGFKKSSIDFWQDFVSRGESNLFLLDGLSGLSIYEGEENPQKILSFKFGVCFHMDILHIISMEKVAYYSRILSKLPKTYLFSFMFSIFSFTKHVWRIKKLNNRESNFNAF